MENKRPRLDDPIEYAIIKSIYFKDNRVSKDIDPIEENDRIDSRLRNNKKSSR